MAGSQIIAVIQKKNRVRCLEHLPEINFIHRNNVIIPERNN